MATFQPADNLRSRTFLGLLVAQFLAAFNDQAIHASSMFFAINTNTMSKDTAISLMPILFYAPWALFCTLAGYLADRYSKWNSLVFWKVAEVAITAVALLGFWLGPPFGPYLVLSTVFLMGTHSAFFVPAKYGAMPEILQPHMLSRGNGLLESLSFLAVILGTVLGGVLSQVFRGQEYYIGLVLVGLAVVGALASLLMNRMPAANPHRPFPPYLYQPLWQSIRTLLRSRPLALAVVGIAFFTFIVAFMRSTMYMHGQTRVPPWDEAQTSEVVGMVALGIGLGSPLVGFLSGGKVELGMVPIGAVGMIAATLIAACALDQLPALVVCITLIGFFTGFYIVPLFTLLQHRAAKTSKGDAIATSNFINVTGAIVASVMFFLMVGAAHLTGITPRVPPGTEIEGELVEQPEYKAGKPVRLVIQSDDGKRVIRAKMGNGHPREIDVEPELIDVFGGGLRAGDRVIDRSFRLESVTYHRIRRADQEAKPFYDESGLPRLLFFGAASLTLLTLLMLWRQLPDLFLRTLIWLRTQPRYRLEIEGLNQLPDKGPAIIATNARGLEACLHVVSAADRATQFVTAEEEESVRLPAWLRLAARRSLLGRWLAGADGTDEQMLLRKMEGALERGGVVAVSLDDSSMAERLLGELAKKQAAPVLPVWYEIAPRPERKRRQRIYILGGQLLRAGATMEEVERELRRLQTEFKELADRGEPLKHAEFVKH
jgi:MFS family permease